MRLTLGEFEKRDRVAKPVARQPFGPENGIVKRNRQGRVVRAHDLALFLRLVLDLSEGQQPAGRLALEHFGPALKALATGHRALFGGVHIRNAAKLIKGPVFHRSSPSLGEDRRGSGTADLGETQHAPCGRAPTLPHSAPCCTYRWGRIGPRTQRRRRASYAWMQSDEALMNAGRPLPSGRVGQIIAVLQAVEDDAPGVAPPD